MLPVTLILYNIYFLHINLTDHLFRMLNTITTRSTQRNWHLCGRLFRRRTRKKRNHKINRWKYEPEHTITYLCSWRRSIYGRVSKIHLTTFTPVRKLAWCRDSFTYQLSLIPLNNLDISVTFPSIDSQLTTLAVDNNRQTPMPSPAKAHGNYFFCPTHGDADYSNCPTINTAVPKKKVKESA